jgi:hypothetical protein
MAVNIQVPERPDAAATRYIAIRSARLGRGATSGGRAEDQSTSQEREAEAEP